MENLSTAIRAIFGQMDGDSILEALGYFSTTGNESNEVLHMDVDMLESTIVNKLLKVDKNSTIDQISMLCQLIQFKWMEKDASCLSLQFHETSSVYNLLLYFSSRSLIESYGDPLCRYNYLLRWHLLTTSLGEDLLTTSFLASRDILLKYNRNSFDWSAFLGHDSKEINTLFEKPMVDLHMHLNGSSFNFDISWICLMNNIKYMQNCFDKERAFQKYKDKDLDLYKKIERAAIIRYYLAGAIGCIPMNMTSRELKKCILMENFSLEEFKQMKNEAPKDDENENVLNKEEYIIPSYQSKIDNTLKQTQDKTMREYNMLKEEQKFTDVLEENDILDYIPITHRGNEYIENKILASERKLMYKVFRAIYEDKNNTKKEIATLFYAYLSYKSYFRNNFLQLNDRVGFANFASYEERKTDFILDKYNHLLYKAAIEGFIEKNDGRRIEARIVPKETESGIVSQIQNICKEIDNLKYGDRYDFIFHFIKKRDEGKNNKYRHYELRNKIKNQAYAIFNFRCDKSNWDKNNNLVGRVVGLDAANSEIYCRPEVFAQAFRFLRGHGIEGSDATDSRPDDLKITYHVGEDFLDVADGLRAVEEAMIFLNLSNGDRLGHALALGTDVRMYYGKRYNTICASKQVLLDNLAWLHHKCVRLMGYSSICGWFEMLFHKYFNEIYRGSKEKEQHKFDVFFSDSENDDLSDNIHVYYLSWLLRGNSPIFGSEISADSLYNATSIETQWKYAGVNHHIAVEMACMNTKAKELFDKYHSQPIAKRGQEADTLRIPKQYREEFYTLLEKIQEQLLHKVEKNHISIECNPSSNFKIGEMERYDEHPILKFFNYGLNTPYPSHDIAVSINTDDQGIFATSLEREYSLMALAMERNQTEEYKNSPRAIIEWLERVREISMEQRFKH